MPPKTLVMLTLLAAACDRSRPPPCGFGALAGYTVLRDQFSQPQQTLSAPPASLPEKLVVRLVAGPAYPAFTGRTGETLVVGVEGTLPANARPTYGVLVIDPGGVARGVVLYENEIVRGAPRIGTVSLGSSVVPLIGVQVDLARVQDANCPLFPDSILQ